MNFLLTTPVLLLIRASENPTAIENAFSSINITITESSIAEKAFGSLKINLRKKMEDKRSSLLRGIDEKQENVLAFLPILDDLSRKREELYDSLSTAENADKLIADFLNKKRK